MWYGRPHWDRSVYLNCPNHQAHCTHTRSDFEKHYARDIEAMELQQRARMARERDAAREAASAREAQERRQQEEARRAEREARGRREEAEKERREEAAATEAADRERREEQNRKREQLRQKQAELATAKSESGACREENERKLKSAGDLQAKLTRAREALFKESEVLKQLRDQKARIMREISTLTDSLRAVGLRGGVAAGSVSMAFADFLTGIDEGLKAVDETGNPGAAFLKVCTDAPSKLEERKAQLAENARIERQLEPLRRQKSLIESQIEAQQRICDRLRVEHSDLDHQALEKKEAQTVFYNTKVTPLTHRISTLEAEVASLSAECSRF